MEIPNIAKNIAQFITETEPEYMMVQFKDETEAELWKIGTEKLEKEMQSLIIHLLDLFQDPYSFNIKIYCYVHNHDELYATIHFDMITGDDNKKQIMITYKHENKQSVRSDIYFV